MFLLQEEEQLGGWQVPPIWFVEEIAQGLRKRSQSGGNHKLETAQLLGVCRCPGRPQLPRTFQGQGACTTEPGKLMFLFQALYVTSLFIYFYF